MGGRKSGGEWFVIIMGALALVGVVALAAYLAAGLLTP